MRYNLTGGIVVYVLKDNNPFYYYAENSVWLLDDWHRQIEDMSYWEYIAKFKIDILVLINDVLLVASIQSYFYGFVIFVDFVDYFFAKGKL